MISDEKFKALNSRLIDMYSFMVKDQDGNDTDQIDYTKVTRTTQMNLGRFYTEINYLLWKERLILAEMEEQQIKNKRNVLEQSKYNVKYKLENQKELETYILGDPVVAKQEEQIKKEKATIEFLTNCLSQATYCAQNVKVLLEVVEQKKKYFGQ